MLKPFYITLSNITQNSSDYEKTQFAFKVSNFVQMEISTMPNTVILSSSTREH